MSNTELEVEKLDEVAAVDTLKPNSMPGGIPDSRAAILAQVMAVAGGMSKDDLNKFAASLEQIGHEADGISGDSAAKNAATIATKKSMKEDIDEMFINDNLSEEFREKAATLFESAVHARLVVEAALIQEAAEELVIEQTQEILEQLTSKIDESLNYVVEKWMEENSVAIESSLKAECMESFIEGLKNLFTEHYIEVPEEKMDVVEELGNRVDELEEQLNTSIAENIELRKSVVESSMAEIFSGMCEGLASTQVEKFRTLAEGINFDGDIDTYSSKLSQVKESYFSVKKGSTNLVLEESPAHDLGNHLDEGTATVSGPMSSYMSAISRNVKNR